ncbi:Prefoldin subunit 6, KE2 family [Phaffia rhodozyma]|uniref:Prefoldin subunit 6, KE2 family n=1 Tax=Phaffia rhodozyma TaxID=264483 RepID=A0A0F7SR19_PHARH|nr:Prefoldin subunit 6, KE2 family [Phaffia rhodozyma]
MSSTKSLESRLEESTIEFQKLQTDLSNAVEARQRLDSQKSENEGVLKEFAVLKPHNTIYKMIGPSLVKQEQAEAKSNVEKRLEFINSEIVRVEKTLADLSTRSEKKKLEIVAMQQESQAQA